MAETTEPFFLSKAMAIEAARKAWNENRLGCQDPNERKCRYRYANGRVCAIGAGLPDHAAQDGNTVRGLIHQALITTDDETFLDALQIAHDKTCDPDEGESRFGNMDHFCALIGVEPPSPVPPPAAG